MRTSAFSAIRAGVIVACVGLFSLLAVTLAAQAQTIGNHRAIYDANGALLPWTPWRDAIQREVNWYLNCPVEHGYPRFVYIYLHGRQQL